MLLERYTQKCFYSCELHSQSGSLEWSHYSERYCPGIFLCCHHEISRQTSMRSNIQPARFMGPTWGPGGPHVGPMNLAVRGAVPHGATALLSLNLVGSISDTFMHATRQIECDASRVPTASRESKLRIFQGPFQDKTRCFKDIYRKFNNAGMLKIYYLNKKLVPHNCSQKPISLNWKIFALWMKISKIWLLKHTGCLQDKPKIFANQTFIYQSAKNKEFSYVFLQTSECFSST